MKLRTFLFCSLLGAAGLLATPASAAGISLGITPAQGTVTAGGTTLVDLTIAGLGNMTAPSLEPGTWICTSIPRCSPFKTFNSAAS